MLSDPVADMLTRIRNAYLVRQKTVRVPYSRFKEKISQEFLKHQFLESVKREKKDLVIGLRYEKGKPVITKIERVSKPGLRVYQRRDKLPYVLSGFGIALVSTSQGVMTAREARKKNLGGEVICKVW